MVNHNWTAFLSHYPLKELRRRQDILNQQLAEIDKRTNPEIVQRMIDMQDSITETILIKYT